MFAGIFGKKKDKGKKEQKFSGKIEIEYEQGGVFEPGGRVSGKLVWTKREAFTVSRITLSMRGIQKGSCLSSSANSTPVPKSWPSTNNSIVRLKLHHASTTYNHDDHQQQQKSSSSSSISEKEEGGVEDSVLWRMICNSQPMVIYKPGQNSNGSGIAGGKMREAVGVSEYPFNVSLASTLPNSFRWDRYRLSVQYTLTFCLYLQSFSKKHPPQIIVIESEFLVHRAISDLRGLPFTATKTPNPLKHPQSRITFTLQNVPTMIFPNTTLPLDILIINRSAKPISALTIQLERKTIFTPSHNQKATVSMITYSDAPFFPLLPPSSSSESHPSNEDPRIQNVFNLLIPSNDQDELPSSFEYREVKIRYRLLLILAIGSSHWTIPIKVIVRQMPALSLKTLYAQQLPSRTVSIAPSTSSSSSTSSLPTPAAYSATPRPSATAASSSTSALPYQHHRKAPAPPSSTSTTSSSSSSTHPDHNHHYELDPQSAPYAPPMYYYYPTTPPTTAGPPDQYYYHPHPEVMTSSSPHPPHAFPSAAASSSPYPLTYSAPYVVMTTSDQHSPIPPPSPSPYHNHNNNNDPPSSHQMYPRPLQPHPNSMPLFPSYAPPSYAPPLTSSTPTHSPYPPYHPNEISPPLPQEVAPLYPHLPHPVIHGDPYTQFAPSAPPPDEVYS